MERRIPIRRHRNSISSIWRAKTKTTGLRGALATVARQRHLPDKTGIYNTIETKIVELALHRGGGATRPGSKRLIGRFDGCGGSESAFP